MCHKQDKNNIHLAFPGSWLALYGTAPISELPRVAHNSAFLDSGTIIIDNIDGCGNVIELDVLAWAHIPSHTHRTHTYTSCMYMYTHLHTYLILSLNQIIYFFIQS